MIQKKSAEEILIMREGGKRLAEILRLVVNMARAGASTADLDKEAERRIRMVGGEPAFKGYKAFGISGAFPGSICVSINEEVVHGLPYPERVIKEGDVVSIDIGMKYKGYYTDHAYTVAVGQVTPSQEKLLKTTKRALDVVLDHIDSLAADGEKITTGEIGRVIEECVEGAGFNVVRELVGHGVGKSLHEDPSVPNFRIRGQGDILAPGTVVAIEPMVYEGKVGVTFASDDWPVFTTHGGTVAHFEHTVAIRENGIEVLTA